MSAQPNARTYLEPTDICDVTGAQVSVIQAPFLGATAAMMDAVAGHRRGLPDEVRQDLASALPSDAAGILDPLARSAIYPNIVTPHDWTRDTTIEEAAGAIESSGRGRLELDLFDEFGEIPPQWRLVTRRPELWTRRYAALIRAVANTWQLFDARTSQLMDREVERIGQAVVRGGLAELLNGLHPCARFIDTSRSSGSGRLTATYAPRRIVLAPITAGSRAGYDCVRGDVYGMAYALPGLGNVWDARVRPLPDDLAGRVLGRRRAAILRFLDRPATMTEIAAHIAGPASSASAHCDWLERTGLVERERRGKHIRVHRTARGSELLEVLAEP